MVMRVFKGCSKQVKERAYQSIVRPQLEYAGNVWDPYQDFLVRELERVQRRAARFVMGDFRQTSSVQKMLDNLGWEDLRNRRQRARLIGMYGAVQGDMAWGDIRERIDIGRTFRGRRDHDMKIRLEYRKRNWGKFSFLGRGVREWNNLSGEILNPFPKTLPEFKRRLCKKYCVK